MQALQMEGSLVDRPTYQPAGNICIPCASHKFYRRPDYLRRYIGLSCNARKGSGMEQGIQVFTISMRISRERDVVCLRVHHV